VARPRVHAFTRVYSPRLSTGCMNFSVLAGPTYTSRLWCVLECFTFLKMGGDVDRIIMMPIGGYDDGDLLKGFLTFDARHADCFKPDEREHLLGVIESGFSSFENFNALVLWRRPLAMASRRGRTPAGRGAAKMLQLEQRELCTTHAPSTRFGPSPIRARRRTLRCRSWAERCRMRSP
jgi:hypothetical protein